MTRTQALQLFDEHRSTWLRSATGRRAVSDIQHALLTEGHNEATRILADDGVWRVSLLALGTGSSLPIHDHPGTRGFLQVITGALRIHRYDVIARAIGGRTAVLIDRGERTLGIGEYDWFGIGRNNLHALDSKAAFTLVFSIRQHVQPHKERKAYAFLREPMPHEREGVAITKPIRASG